jgi:hypothetical protein
MPTSVIDPFEPFDEFVAGPGQDGGPDGSLTAESRIAMFTLRN